MYDRTFFKANRADFPLYFFRFAYFGKIKQVIRFKSTFFPFSSKSTRLFRFNSSAPFEKGA